MGRRDSEGKKKPWMIEAGDWERLYEALLKAKEKNIMLDVRLEREKDVIELERKHRDRSLFNDIFEQKQLAFKYKCQKNKTERVTNSTVEEAKADRRKMIRKMTMPNISVTKQPLSITQSAQKNNIGGVKHLTLPLVKNGAYIGKSIVESSKPHEGTTSSDKQTLKRSCTLPNLYTLFDKSGQKQLNAPYWVGDPEAINSVRRPRLNPDEMTDHSQPNGEARKLLIELATPQTCSRQYTTRSEASLPGVNTYHMRPAGSQQNLLSVAGLLQ